MEVTENVRASKVSQVGRAGGTSAEGLSQDVRLEQIILLSIEQDGGCVCGASLLGRLGERANEKRNLPVPGSKLSWGEPWPLFVTPAPTLAG